MSLLLSMLCVSMEALAMPFTITINCPDSLPPYFDPTAMEIEESCGGGNDQVILDSWIMTKAGAIPIDTCNAAQWLDFDYVSSDGINGTSISFDSLQNYPEIPAGDCQWSVQVFFRATDDLGNQSVTNALFSLEDSEDPFLLGVPSDEVVNCDAIPARPVLYSDITAVDNCDTIVFIRFFESSTQTNSGLCTDYNYSISRTWTATDDCGNEISQSQNISVIDITPPTFTAPPDITIDCDQNILPEFTGYVSNVSDNCDMQPDTLYNDIFSAGGCVNNYTITRIWTLRDACNNTSTASIQTISVIDTIVPSFAVPASDELFICSSPNMAETAFQDWVANFGNAQAMDNCSPDVELEWYAAVPGSYQLNNPLSIEAPGSLDAADCPSNELGVYRSEMVDFIVYDECGNASVSSATFKVVDDQAPVFTYCANDTSINNISGTCIANFTLPVPTLSEACENSSYIELSYRLNGLPRVAWNPADNISVVLTGGNNTITYIGRDCAGNESQCSFNVNVIDLDPPIVTCLSDTLLSLSSTDNCATGVALRLPFVAEATDNCNFPIFVQTQPSTTTDAFITFSYDSDYMDYMADDKTYTFIGTAANAIGTEVNLGVLLIADAEDTEAYYSIFDENGILIGTTEVGQAHVNLTPGDCNANPIRPPFLSAQFQIPAAQYNLWAEDGRVTFTAVHHTNFSTPAPGAGGEGINPLCTPFSSGTPDGSSDGISFMTMNLSYNQITPQYFVSGATNVPLTDMLPPLIRPELNFLPGTSTVTYIIEDLAGNRDSCAFDVVVEDQINPEPQCKPDTIFVNPSGLIPYILDPSEVDAGSTDNCMVDSLLLDKDTFDCTMLGTTQTIELTVVDDSGNRASCNTTVRVAAAPPVPSYSIGLCGNDTLYLRTNPPFAPIGFAYTYSWTGPLGFSAAVENPFIENATAINSGFYIVEIIGQNGCSVKDSVEVLINAVPDMPDIQANETDLCQNDELILTSQSYTGAAISYYWYTGTAPGGIILDTTTVPSLIIPPPLTSESYYVVVEVDGCSSAFSSNIMVNVTTAPVANTSTPFINICQEEEIVLGTSTSGPSLIYNWTGPNNFSSSLQNPTPFPANDLNQGGVYTLIVSANDCPSIPSETFVLVKEKPLQPSLSSNGIACEGETVLLTASPTAADVYTWLAPDGSIQITTANTLLINNVGMDAAGEWKLLISENGCTSDTSSGVNVFVEPLPVFTASNNGPGCENGMIILTTDLIPGASYEWTGPNGFLESGQEVTAPAVPGTYTVEVSTSLGCVNQSNTVVVVNELPKITALSTDAAACVNGLDTIQLIPTIFPPDDGTYTYQWTGPNNFNSTDAMPFLPNGTGEDNGMYQLIVTNGAACESLADSISLLLVDAPEKPTIADPGLVCEGQSLQFMSANYPGGNVSYTWTTPLGIFTTSLATLDFASAINANTGEYSVVVTVDGCTSISSDTLTIQVNTGLPLPELRSNSPVCEGDTIFLETDSIVGGQYNWTSPGNDILTGSMPIIPNASTIHDGQYTVEVDINGCSSPVSLPVNVVVTEKPSAPTLFNDGPVCIDDSDAVLTLGVLPGTEIPGAIYTWFLSPSGMQVGGPSISTQLAINNFTGYGEGTFEFYAVANLNGCLSDSSALSPVVMNEVPDFSAFAGLDTALCDQDTFQLNADTPVLGTGFWTQIAGPPISIQDQVDPTTNLFGLPQDTSITMQWTLSYGVCADYSSDETSIQLNTTNQKAVTDTSIVICNQDTTFLSAEPATGLNSGVWTQTNSQQGEGVIIHDATASSTMISGLLPGNSYTFFWHLMNEACDTFSTATVNLMVSENMEIASAGDDMLACGQGESFLMAEFPLTGNGQWTSSDPTINIVNPSDPDTEIRGLDDGIYTFIWTLDNGDCGITTDTVEIEYAIAPLGIEDQFNVSFARDLAFNVLDNDAIPAGGAFVIPIDQPLHGSLSNTGDGEFVYEPDPAFAGIDSFHYEICSRICTDVCQQITVILIVGDDENCFVPTIITPNNDQVNDQFVIPCLATNQYPANQVKIFNSWGDLIYQASPYQNDWEGTYNGEELPGGSYYYIIEFGRGRKPISNFLVIER